jgi:hypothetical protein
LEDLPDVPYITGVSRFPRIGGNPVTRMRFTGMSYWELYTFGPPAETIGACVAGDAADLACTDVWTVMSTARAIRRFTASPGSLAPPGEGAGGTA